MIADTKETAIGEKRDGFAGIFFWIPGSREKMAVEAGGSRLRGSVS
jgi:hypothetical protein